jgi:alkanesulfonate monooxygenase SsuD/methylene tetrahydromethanopterin reductase-like flavin-dependent oxidoreductase (luciferase family)
MTERLALGIVPGIGWRAREIEMVAREAEDAGFEAIFNPEVNNDALATAQLMGTVTSSIRVGPWVSSIYLRHSYVCAQAAALIADATGERLILGLGVSHPLVNRTFGVGSTSPLEAMRDYVTEVQTWLRGEGPTTHLPQHPAPCRVPIHIAALTSKAVELAGEVADGVMPYLWSTARVTAAKAWIARGRARSPVRAPLELSLGLPVYVGDDMTAVRELARQNLAFYTTLPYYQRVLRLQGFAAEAAKAEQGDPAGAWSDRLLDALCLIGPVGYCRERLDAYREAGVGLPILYPPIGVEAARATINAFRQ